MSEGQIAAAFDALNQAAVAVNQAHGTVDSLLYPAVSEETRAAVAAFPCQGTERSKTLCRRAQMTWAPKKSGTRRGSGNHEPKKLFPHHTI